MIRYHLKSSINSKPNKGYGVKEKRKLPILVFLIIRHSGDKGIIDIKDPSIRTIAFKGTTLSKIHNTLFNSPLRINSVLNGSGVFTNITNAFFRHNLKESDVVKLDVQSPAFAVVFEADFEAIFGPLVENVPV